MGDGLTYVRISSTKLLERNTRMSRFSSMCATYNGGKMGEWEDIGLMKIREASPNFECGGQAALFIPTLMPRSEAGLGPYLINTQR